MHKKITGIPQKKAAVNRAMLDEQWKTSPKFKGLFDKSRGHFFETAVGQNYVYKRPMIKGYFAKLDGIADRDESIRWGERQRLNAESGWEKLRANNIPVVQYHGRVSTGVNRAMSESLKFEKARDLTHEETRQRIDEITRIIKLAADKNLDIDPQKDNFGIDRNNRVVLRDTNWVEKKDNYTPKELYDQMVRDFKQSAKDPKLSVMAVDTVLENLLAKEKKKHFG